MMKSTYHPTKKQIPRSAPSLLQALENKSDIPMLSLKSIMYLMTSIILLLRVA